jgi:thiamine-phosphate pyrophosphorylase
MKAAFPPLYGILSAELITTSAPELAVTLAEAGVALIQYRNKRATPRGLLDVSAQIAKAVASHSTRFIVNDRGDVAVLVGAQGVHVGQDDLPVDAARTMANHANFWVGISTHTLDQVRAAASTSADYIAIGPIFATSTKENPDRVVGVDFIRQARMLTTKPLVAIGGITAETAADVFAAGADCVAVARDLICAPDPAVRAKRYLAIARQAADRVAPRVPI